MPSICVNIIFVFNILFCLFYGWYTYLFMYLFINLGCLIASNTSYDIPSMQVLKWALKIELMKSH